MLLIFVALLILAALGQDHRAAAAPAVTKQMFTLDFSNNSVDDQYIGCRKDMMNLVEKEYLMKEINNSPEFNEAWQKGVKNATKPENNLKENHSIAMYVYTLHVPKLYSVLNFAVHDGMQNYTDKTFEWYSLHFLLTEAIQILKETQKACYNVTYRGTNFTFGKNVLNTEIRFGTFASSTLNRTIANDFGSASCFEIRTCEGANLTKYSRFLHQKEVLIPPYETFNVTAVKTRAVQPDLWCDTVFVLNSTGKRSHMNCALFGSENHVADSNVLLILTLFNVYLLTS
ncbi:ecto-ADP-ribosyltransferase 5-like [Chanodichthys erythropterus]|uniref:ecto-ADP-ribosyltransferase 5-like n=1 Tax=Chanodichthys erythropterus TaxID=933992 RepID=UPI00351DD61A